MFKTVRSKFIFSALIFILLSVGVPAAFLITQFRENFKERSIMMLETSLNVVNASINYAMLNENKNIQDILDGHVNNNIKDIRIFDASGIIKHSSNKSEIGDDIRMINAHQDIDLKSKSIVLLNEEKIYTGSMPIENKHACKKCHESGNTIAFIDMDFNLSGAETNFYTGVRHSTFFLSSAIIIFLVAGLYFLFNRFINTPLQSVILGLGEVEKGNLTVRQKINNDDEFGSLNRHFNTMVAQLEKSLKEIDQFHFKQLQRADKLVTLGELAAEMAHEINNPTGVIMTRADFLKLESDENETLKKYQDDINVIISQADKIAQITKSVLKYSKKRQQEYQNLNLVSTVENSLKLFEPSLEKRNILVSTNFVRSDNCNEPLVLANPQQIEQIITNILNNSIDAIGVNGQITIDITCQDKKYIQLRIKDNGPGIDPVVREQIFLPFFTTKSDKNGTGLGLYIVKNICQHHDADIFCDSALNKGTTFTINFKQVLN